MTTSRATRTVVDEILRQSQDMIADPDNQRAMMGRFLRDVAQPMLEWFSDERARSGDPSEMTIDEMRQSLGEITSALIGGFATVVVVEYHPFVCAGSAASNKAFVKAMTQAFERNLRNRIKTAEETFQDG